MPRAPTIRAADLDRVLKALAKAGQTVDRVEVRPGGSVLIVPKPAPARAPTAAADPAATLTPEPPARDVSDLDRFREEKRKRGLRAPQGT
jgi:hypothetical protein